MDIYTLDYSGLLIGIDPSPYDFSVAIYNSEEKRLVTSFSDDRERIKFWLDSVCRSTAMCQNKPIFVIEMIASFGQAGADLFQTCVNIGWLESELENRGLNVVFYTRQTVKFALGIKAQATDSQVRKKLLTFCWIPDKVGKKDEFQAAAVAVAYSRHPELSFDYFVDRERRKKNREDKAQKKKDAAKERELRKLRKAMNSKSQKRRSLL